MSLSSNLWYQLSNNYTGATSFLAASSINGALFMSNSTSPTTHWQFLNRDNHTYSIKNQAAGSDFQLGIEYGTPTDSILARPVLQISHGTTQSQRWTFLPEEDGFTVVNVQLGNIFFLDLFGDTLEPCLDTWGGYWSQYWTIEEVSGNRNVSSTQAPISNSTVTSISSTPTHPSSPPTSGTTLSTSGSLPTESSFKSRLLPMGVLFGIGFGVLLVGMVAAMGLGFWIFNFRQKRAWRALRRQTPEDTYITVPEKEADPGQQVQQRDGGDSVSSESQPEKKRKDSKVQFELQETFR